MVLSCKVHIIDAQGNIKDTAGFEPTTPCLGNEMFQVPDILVSVWKIP